MDGQQLGSKNKSKKSQKKKQKSTYLVSPTSQSNLLYSNRVLSNLSSIVFLSLCEIKVNKKIKKEKKQHKKGDDNEWVEYRNRICTKKNISVKRCMQKTKKIFCSIRKIELAERTC